MFYIILINYKCAWPASWVDRWANTINNDMSVQSKLDQTRIRINLHKKLPKLGSLVSLKCFFKSNFHLLILFFSFFWGHDYIKFIYSAHQTCHLPEMWTFIIYYFAWNFSILFFFFKWIGNIIFGLKTHYLPVSQGLMIDKW